MSLYTIGDLHLSFSTISFKESSNSYRIISTAIRIMHLLEQNDIVMKEKIR